ncbi:tripartite tricarboxylate transporter permease [Xenorhabdus szentirmaii]|uniref:tripartite tricarboxylate transporter permease n=1 Tax=Xenorhabdus szentirmaii TaxID=290112 RepID=UPI0032B87A77
METWTYLSQGFEVALVPQNLVIALIGCFIGTVVGLLPGLGPINGVAILLPLAFALKLPAESALILLATVYIGCEYGGRISSILLNVPGDAAAIMTALDGYPMAKQGRAGVALSISAVSSFCGSLLAITGIILFAPILAQWSLAFGPAEYFALMVFAIACLGSMMSQNPVKSLFAALIGLALATVGVDSNTGVYRFTFGSVHLSDGIQFIVVVIGLFSVSEILLMLESTSTGQSVISKTGRLLFNRKEAAICAGPTLRSSLIGFFVGILPGAGATIASAITYMTEKRISGNSDSFGKGDIRGVAAPEAANNASACGSFIPMLTLGVPGSGTTAVMIGALTLYNITPGPTMFTEQPDIVWGLIAALLIANILLLIMNIPMIRLFTRMLSIPTWFLVPTIAIISSVGVYAVHSTTFDLMLMIGLGVFGYILRKMNFPMSPLILGFVLGEMLEQNLRRALSISNGNFGILWSSTITQVLLILAVLVIIIPPVVRIVKKRRNKITTS